MIIFFGRCILAYQECLLQANNDSSDIACLFNQLLYEQWAWIDMSLNRCDGTFQSWMQPWRKQVSKHSLWFVSISSTCDEGYEKKNISSWKILNEILFLVEKLISYILLKTNNNRFESEGKKKIHLFVEPIHINQYSELHRYYSYHEVTNSTQNITFREEKWYFHRH